MTDSIKNITVLGDGGWGTANALLLAEKGYNITIWGYDAEYLKSMDAAKENKKFLSGFTLTESISFQPDINAAVESADVLVIAIPTQFLRPSLKNISAKIPELVISLAKGVEKVTMARPTEIINSLLGIDDCAVLSGPSHAEEVAKRLPASVVVACKNNEKAIALQHIFNSETFRVYRSTDAVGVELGGALKNVMAVAVGICEGLGLGDNARSALMTRGLAEMTRMGVAFGGSEETFRGLSGMGDLITTCVSPFGRNRAVGLALADGKTLQDILESTEQVAEGVHTCESVCRIASEKNIEMPIAECLYQILYNSMNPKDAVSMLMTRKPKAE
jgi:glycerol-3-phosphate dehydrogenase (NAD(P)+)